ncbi:LysR family transcriptional regulator [Rhodococcus sp. BP-252]|uniref:LysR family transcriptional regulator n=1 Tax=Rhodococcoides kyotonense TaxID=398843 RepID=A0A177YKD7_9NOCA|nr:MULTISPECIES: LysR family transcriptional regulator [Rhodococcus]MBY6410829.1 LysR family transcriptional regulator [Rhodococcus sp. BP-320]MBY6415346.1 LysR family transcriptional regulator [Rhodococcus sp. BP-321]MBY6419961.1 LysR family transcriptional regulator [Rhodococcus sp. BP-324]MBY6425385.1 LysR family transcriptional regulator [Rhodococcus sp. BP-323]MBY6430552.1 LysR family transcriptional regulator [Rhodococcus sp. BP-322]
MNVERLRILRELADRGTVGAVAVALSLTPSAVSQQLKLLSKEAGVALLEPDGRRLRLTDAGHALVLRADEVLGALRRATAEMESYSASPKGRVRVALFPSGAALLLPGVLDRLRDSGTRVVARDEDLPASSVPALLADYDVVLTHRDDRAPATAAARIEVESLMREPIDLVLPPSHSLASRQSVDLRELADEHWISVRGGFPVDDVLLSVAAATGVQPRVVQRINDFRVTEELVARGHGVALLPRYAVVHPALVRIPLSGVRAGRIYELATRPRARELPAVRAVVEAFEAEAARVHGNP